LYKRFFAKNIFVCGFLIFYSCAEEDIDLQKQYNNPGASINTSDPKELTQLFFVGKYGAKAGVYKFEFASGSYKIFWGSNEETVIKLSHSNDLENIFFLTARRVGMRRGVSSIRDIKLYRINLNNLSSELLTHVGDAVQLYSYWSGTNYHIQFTRFDQKYASHIAKFNQVYSQFGKLLKEEKENFNFIEDSYPEFYIPHQPLISPSGNFGIKQLQDSIYLYASGSEQKIFIDSSDEKVSKVGWSEEERFVFFTLNTESKGNEISTIYIFDIINKKILQKFTSSSKISFYVTGDVLIYGNKNADQSTIETFNFRKNISIHSIKLWGGCGLHYISDY
jgi:hypothetical protein